MIAVQNLSMRAGPFMLKDVSFTVATGAYAVLMGRTGCGKTTLLEAITGLKPIERGAIHLDGRDVTNLKPGERGIGYVPQDRALFPTMTVRENLAFALRVRRWRKEQVACRVGELADLLGIAPLLDRRPAGLSGGEAQRVALGRALACGPAVMCLDEPLSALDSETRTDVQQLLRTVQQRTGVTMLHVTHDRDEARRLADVVFQFIDGGVRQTDGPG